jgi:hypothetical protein
LSVLSSFSRRFVGFGTGSGYRCGSATDATGQG